MALTSVLNNNNSVDVEHFLGRVAPELLAIVGSPSAHHGIHRHAALVPIVSHGRALSKEGEYGRNKINQYTRFADHPTGNSFRGWYGQMFALNNFSNVKVFSNFGLFS